MSARSALLALVFGLLAAPAALAESFAGRVVAVYDGDTLGVLRGGREERVRLWGIDCPERHQPFGAKARELAARLAFGREATVETRDRDKYGRLVGWVRLPDGAVLNRELVREGLAWWYRRYAPAEAGLAALESEARSARRGLWADDQPTAPWEFRREQRVGE